MTRDSKATLPELLFAIAGICLLLLAVAARSADAAGVPVSELVARIHVVLQMARLEAVAVGNSRVVVDPGAGRVEVWTGGDREALALGLALPRGTRLTWIGDDPAPRPGEPFEIVFDRGGFPLAGQGEILVDSGDELASVEILADGDFRVTEPANDEIRAGL